jgi:hypothetical protein
MSVENKKILSHKQRSFFSQMSKLISTPKHSKRHHSEQLLQRNPQSSALVLLTSEKPFDNSIYDSNQIHQVSSKDSLISRTTQKSKRHITY